MTADDSRCPALLPKDALRTHSIKNMGGRGSRPQISARGRSSRICEVQRGSRGRDELHERLTKCPWKGRSAQARQGGDGAGGLFTTESGFFQTILERHEEAQKSRNTLSAQLRAAVPAPKAD